MDAKQHLKATVLDFVHDKKEQASLSLHTYLQAKMQDVISAKKAAGDTSGSASDTSATE